MPRVTIWIKKEDWDNWQAIADKPKWLHEHLHKQHDVPPDHPIHYNQEIARGLGVDEPTITEPEETA